MPEEPISQSVEGKEFTVPYDPGEIRIPGGSLIYQPVFHLTKAEWILLKYGKGTVSKIAWTSLFIGLGSGFILIAKFLNNSFVKFFGSSHTPHTIQSWEWYPPGIALVLFIIFLVIDSFVSNESKKVRKTINDWFEEAQAPKER